jgi:hypothetical protein
VSGSLIAAQVALIPTIIAKPYDAVYLHLAQNDMATTTPLASLLATYTTAIQQIQAAGKAVYIQTLNPRAPTGAYDNTNVKVLGDPVYRRTTDFNFMLVDLAAQYGCELIDTRPVLCDTTYGAGSVALSGVSADGLHLSNLGSYLVAGIMDAVFRRTILPGNAHINLNAGDAANLFPNGLLTGTGGTIATTTGWSGTVPNQVRVATVTGTAAGVTGLVASIISDPEENGANAVQLACTLSGANLSNAKTRFLLTDTTGSSGTTSFAANTTTGNWYRGILRVNITTGAQYVQDLYLQLGLTTAQASGTAFTAAVNEYQAGGTFGNDIAALDTTASGLSLWLVTDPVQAKADGTHINFRLEPAFLGTGSVTMQISRPKVVQVSSPII